jgi:hypothetical protein
MRAHVLIAITGFAQGSDKAQRIFARSGATVFANLRGKTRSDLG